MGCVFSGQHGRDKPMEEEDRYIRGFIANGKAQGDWFDLHDLDKVELPFENLIFSGGGVKGYTYVGACYVRVLGIIFEPQNWLACSCICGLQNEFADKLLLLS